MYNYRHNQPSLVIVPIAFMSSYGVVHASRIEAGPARAIEHTTKCHNAFSTQLIRGIQQKP